MSDERLGQLKVTAYDGSLIGWATALRASRARVVNGVLTLPEAFTDFNPRDYGAAVDGVTNDTNALRETVAALEDHGGGRLVIPESTTGMLVGGAGITDYIANSTVPCFIEGYGPRSRIILATGTPTTTDVFRITPPPHIGNAEALLNSPEDNAGWVIQNFAIRPQTAGVGRNGIRVDITQLGSFFQNSFIRGLQIGDLGGNSLAFINTTLASPAGVNADGIFNNFILFNILRGGIFADAFGDSNHVNWNRFWSSFDTTHRALDIAFIAGAGATEFIGNNITLRLTAKIVGGTGVIFANNYIEPFQPTSPGADGACVSFDNGAVRPRIHRNIMRGQFGGNNLNGLYLGSVSGASVDDNDFNIGSGKSGIVVSASASDTNLGHYNSASGGGALLSDSGTGTGTSVFSASGGRVTRVGSPFASALGASSPLTGFSGLDAAVLEIHRNAATSNDSKFAALILGANQTGLNNLLGAAYFVNTSLAGDDDRVATISGSTDGAANSGRIDISTKNAGTSSVKFSVRRNRLQFPNLPVYADNAAALAGGLTTDDVYRTGADPSTLCVVFPSTAMTEDGVSMTEDAVTMLET